MDARTFDNFRLLGPLEPEGAAPSGGGGSWVKIGSEEASSSNITITGLDSTYDQYAIGLSNIVPNTDGDNIYMRMGDAGGIDSGATDYVYHKTNVSEASTAYAAVVSVGLNGIKLIDGPGNAAGEGCGGMYYLHRPGDGTMWPIISGTATLVDQSTVVEGGPIAAARTAVIDLTQIQILGIADVLLRGRVTVWGLSHA